VPMSMTQGGLSGRPASPFSGRSAEAGRSEALLPA
jgi:hypothetical protein